MRYDTEVYFRLPPTSVYNTQTGNYEEGAAEETQAIAAVVNTDIETLRLVYGELKQGSLTIHLQNKSYTKVYAGVRIGEKIYSVDHVKNFRNKQVLVVTEEQ